MVQKSSQCLILACASKITNKEINIFYRPINNIYRYKQNCYVT